MKLAHLMEYLRPLATSTNFPITGEATTELRSTVGGTTPSFPTTSDKITTAGHIYTSFGNTAGEYHAIANFFYP